MTGSATLSRGYSLPQYVEDLHAVFEEGLALPALLREIAERKRRLLMEGAPLSASQCARLEDKPYTRNLLHRDPAGRFVVVAILWGPHSISPVHDHRTWGVMGVVENYVRITNFERLDDGSQPGRARLQEKEALLAPRGAVGYVLPPFQEIHRMENPTAQTTVGIHTYGQAVEECTIFDLESGATSNLALHFDHDASGELGG